MKKVILIVQSLLVLAIVVLGVLYFCGYKYLLDTIELILGCDLIVLGISNIVIAKKMKYALVYFIVGGIILILVILKMVGVQI